MNSGSTSKESGGILQVYSLVVTVIVFVFAAALTLSPNIPVSHLLDSFMKVVGPVLAALVAWLGVNHTVANSRRNEGLKEWHTNLRWACELTGSNDDSQVRLGIALLDSLDNSPLLGDSEQSIIDAALTTVVNEEV